MTVQELLAILRSCDGDETVSVRVGQKRFEIESDDVDIYGDEIIINT